MQYYLYHAYYIIYGINKWLTRRFTISGLVVLVCLLVAGAAGIDTNQTMAYQIFTFLLSLLLIAIISSFWWRFRCGLSRNLPKFATVGIPVQYRIIIDNRTNRVQTGLKLWEDLADARPSFVQFQTKVESNEQQPHKLEQKLGYFRWRRLLYRQQKVITRAQDIPTLSPHSKTEVKVTIKPTHRGLVRFTGITITRPDPFGLFNAVQTRHLPQSFWILPKRYKLPQVSLPGMRRYQSGGVALASSVGDMEEFMSLRDYRPGDPLRKIHWKSWAKVGKPIVKEEQDEFFVRHALILDTFQTIAASDKLEEAIAIAASFACQVQTQESLLDLMFVGTEAYCFTTGRGVGHTEKMLEILAAVKACQDKTFEFLIPVVLNRASMLSGCICILLTWDEERQRLVNYLQGMKIPTLVLLVSTEESSPEQDDSLFNQGEEFNFNVLKLGKIQEGLLNIK